MDTEFMNCFPIIRSEIGHGLINNPGIVPHFVPNLPLKSECMDAFISQ